MFRPGPQTQIVDRKNLIAAENKKAVLLQGEPRDAAVNFTQNFIHHKIW